MSLAWGGFTNGSIPTSALHVVPNFAPLGGQQSSVANGSNFMRSDAAFQLSGMMRAFYRARRKVLSLSEGNRPLSVQNWYYNRFMKKLPGWTLAAFPGTSIHGWALSADLNVNGAVPSGDDLAWLRANAAKYGFVNDVATEPWHWSYRTDRVTRTIVVSSFISNPNTDADDDGAGNTSGDDMDKLIRDSKTGEVDWVNVSTGFWRHIDDPKLLPIVEKHLGMKAETVDRGTWEFLRARATEFRDQASDAAAKKVWAMQIDGFNGKHGAGARLAGIDKKADGLSPEAIKAVQVQPGAVTVTPVQGLDVQAVAKAVADMISKRMQA